MPTPDVIERPAEVEFDVGEVYLVTTTDDESLVGAYAGADGDRHVFTTGVFSPLAIPAAKIREALHLG